MKENECRCVCGHIHYSGINCPMCKADKDEMEVTMNKTLEEKVGRIIMSCYTPNEVLGEVSKIIRLISTAIREKEIMDYYIEIIKKNGVKERIASFKYLSDRNYCIDFLRSAYEDIVFRATDNII